MAYTGYVTVERLRIRLQDGVEFWREVERHGNAAAVLPYDAMRRSALTVWTSPGVCTEQVSLFLAPYGGADRTGAGGRARVRARSDHHL
jgi:hypothetical protein